MNRKISFMWISALLVALTSCAKQDERADRTKLDPTAVKQTIQTYIEENTGPEGTFAIKDPVEDRTRQLAFDYVHDSVHETDDGRYYACVDFTEAPEDTLDLDFYVSVDASGAPKVSEVVIHKVNGVSRK